jgi:HTH-type transcriptional regulator/antitoxin HigA
MDTKPIKNERDYEGALRRVELLWNAPKGSAGSDEMDVPATLIETYEREHYPVDMPGPVEAIQFRPEQAGKMPDR